MGGVAVTVGAGSIAGVVVLGAGAGAGGGVAVEVVVAGASEVLVEVEELGSVAELTGPVGTVSSAPLAAGLTRASAHIPTSSGQNVSSRAVIASVNCRGGS